MPKGYPAARQAPAAEDDHDPGTPRVVRTPAGAGPIAKPAGAVNSVFDTVARPQPKPRVSAFNPATLRVHKKLPVPASRSGPVNSIYAEVWAGLEVDDCAELPDRAAHSLVTYCKKNKHPHAIRRLSPTTKGVWKLPPPAGTTVPA